MEIIPPEFIETKIREIYKDTIGKIIYKKDNVYIVAPFCFLLNKKTVKKLTKKVYEEIDWEVFKDL